MGDTVREGSENLTGGQVSGVPTHLVGTGEAITAENLDPRSPFGAVTRNGRAQFGIDFGSDSLVAGLKAFKKNAGTDYVVSRVATTFYSVSAASWASIGIGGTTGEIFRAAALDDLLVIVVDGLVPKYWDGTTFGSLGGTPPSEAKYAAIYVSKVWLAGDDANPQKLTFSATNNAQDFTAADDAGSITTQDGGGDTIQGLMAIRKALLIMYRNFVDILIGDSVLNFRVDRLIDRGLVSKTGYVTAGEVAFFASDDAIYVVAGAAVSDITTMKFRETYRNISDKSKISLGVKGDLLLVVDYGANVAYACDYKKSTWSQWTNQAWTSMDTANDQTFYAGADGGSTVQIWKLDSGSLDGAATITAKWRIPDLAFGWPDAVKNLTAAKVHAKPGIGTVTLTYYKNGSAIGSTTDVSFNSSGGHDWNGRHGQSAARGEYLGMQMQWAGVGTVYGWAIYAEITSEPGNVPLES